MLNALIVIQKLYTIRSIKKLGDFVTRQTVPIVLHPTVTQC